MVDQTPQADRMVEIVAGSASLLKEAGFRKRRHSFNRVAGDGLVHLVFFWMAPKEPPAWTEIRGLRERLYGTFRIEFGVHVPSMNRLHTPRSSWINDYNCHLRRTMGELMDPNSSGLWWPLDDPDATVNAAAVVRDLGLPWLDRHSTARSITAAFEQDPASVRPAGELDIADLYRARGDEAQARRIIERHVATPHRRRYIGTVTRYLELRGYPDLIPRIAVEDPPPADSSGDSR
ncbi:DUF4304 domain-containing protein [Rathayibacter festucae]|uniref:DUF4304 domain-containing protein n=1 Tax=Rathayibacter festucae TaxID=110937 RepID=UPI001FB3A8DD|nr:DUF4304 domain-containing protein [Rathayibacter festucae]MCJ1700419.1 DUF4304 domain-containing protein [Rathayibacter festucae]